MCSFKLELEPQLDLRPENLPNDGEQPRSNRPSPIELAVLSASISCTFLRNLGCVRVWATKTLGRPGSAFAPPGLRRMRKSQYSGQARVVLLYIERAQDT